MNFMTRFQTVQDTQTLLQTKKRSNLVEVMDRNMYERVAKLTPLLTSLRNRVIYENTFELISLFS